MLLGGHKASHPFILSLREDLGYPVYLILFVHTWVCSSVLSSTYPIGTQSGQNRPDYFVDIFLTKAFLSKIFEGEMFIRILPTTLLQIFCENLLYNQVIFRSMKIADNTFLGNPECEWVKAEAWLVSSWRSSRGGGALRYRWGPHLRYVFRGRRGLFLKPPHVRDFVKEGYFFVPRFEVWGSKSPYNPRNIRHSDAE